MAVLAMLGLILAYLHAELYTVYGPFIKLRDWEPIPAWATVVRQMRWLVRGAAATSLATLIVLEIKWGAVGGFLKRIIENRLRLGILLILLGGLSSAYLLLPGYLTAAAAGSYYTQLAWLIRDAMEHGQFPIWSNWGDMGFPLMQFYSPLLFTTIALVNFVIPNIWIATKLLFFGLHILSVIAIFLFVQNLTKSNYAGLAAAFAFGFAYYRYHVIVYLGKYVMGPTFLIWPLQLYFVDRLLTSKDGRRAGIGLALSSAAGLLAHIYFGSFGGVFAALYAAIRLSTPGEALTIPKRRAIVRLIFWFGLGVLAALFYTLPAVLESDLTVISGWYSGGYFGVSRGFGADTLAAVFTFDGSQGRLWVYGYAGNSLLALAVIGCAAALARKKWAALAPLVLLVLTFFLAVGPFTAFFSAQGQFLVYVVIMAAVGVGICMAELERGLPGDFIRRGLRKLGLQGQWLQQPVWLLGLVCALIAYDMLRYTLFINYLIPPTPYGSPSERVAAHQWLAAHGDEFDGRVLDPSQPENGWQIPMVAGLPTYQNNGDSSIYSASFIRNLRYTSPNPLGASHYSVEELFAEAHSLLVIANADWVIADSPTPLEDHPGAIRTDDGAVLIPTGGGLPVIASQTAQVVAPPLQFAPLANQMGIDRDRATATFIPVREPTIPLASGPSGDDILSIKIHDHAMESQYVRIDYTLSAPAYLQLSYTYYPYLRVMIDGQETPAFPTTFGLIGVESPAGDHTIEITPYLSPLRKAVGWINLSALLLLAGLWIESYRSSAWARRS